MKAYIIVLQDDKNQVAIANKLLRSIKETRSDLSPHFLNATTPETLLDDIAQFKYLDKYNWNWPHVPMMDGLDLATGLYKKCYRASDQKKVEACGVSHIRAWEKCIELDEPILVLESDALFTRRFDPSQFEGNGYDLVGLNDPRGATRRAQDFHNAASMVQGIATPPRFNDPQPVPHGIAGNSAYYITPKFAKKLLSRVEAYGMWPNDAIMCFELFPEIRIVYPYYTKVQGTQSTTTG